MSEIKVELLMSEIEVELQTEPQIFVDFKGGTPGPAGYTPVKGVDYFDGVDGKDGEKGLSAYEVWLQEGNTGSEQVFLESLRGDGVVTYVHDQILASEVWEINHDLGFYPLVDVIDSGGTLVIGDVFHVDVNNLILTFSAPFSGKALIK